MSKETGLTFKNHLSRQERQSEKKEFEEEVACLLHSCPTELGQRTIYIRELIYKALRKELDVDILREFCKRAHAVE